MTDFWPKWSLPPAGDDFDHAAYSPDEKRRRLPPGQTLAKKFPHLEYASIPNVSQFDLETNGWTLKIFGECARGGELPLLALPRVYPQTRKVQDFHCITGWSVFDTEWEGVAGLDLIRDAGVDDSVTTVMIHGRDQFSTCLWLEDFAQGMLAYLYRGRRLGPQHGFPLRFVAPPSLYQYKSCKWVTGIEFLTEHKLGFWEIRAYNDAADVTKNVRYLEPEDRVGKTARELRAAFKKAAGEG